MSRIQRDKLRLIQESNRRLLNEQEVPTDNEMTNPIYPDSENALEAIQELLEVSQLSIKTKFVDFIFFSADS